MDFQILPGFIYLGLKGNKLECAYMPMTQRVPSGCSYLTKHLVYVNLVPVPDEALGLTWVRKLKVLGVVLSTVSCEEDD